VEGVAEEVAYLEVERLGCGGDVDAAVRGGDGDFGDGGCGGLLEEERLLGFLADGVALLAAEGLASLARELGDVVFDLGGEDAWVEGEGVGAQGEEVVP
jgi:hypothetical protein